MTLTINIPTLFDQRVLDAYGATDQADLESKITVLVRKRCCDVETNEEINTARTTVVSDYDSNWT